MKRELLFLSNEWIREVTGVIQATRSTDKKFGELARDFTISLVYLVKELPRKLRVLHGGSQVAIQVQLVRGALAKMLVGTEISSNKNDYTVTTDYTTAKRMFLGDANPATAFIDGHVKVEPLRRVYQRPKFTSKAIVIAGAMQKIARHVPTIFPE